MTTTKPTDTSPISTESATPTNATMLQATDTQPFWLLKDGTALKLGARAEGSIKYNVLADNERQQLFIAITGNKGGGYFSKEHVPVDRIHELVGKPNQPAFPSKALRLAFAGKSSNNAGFLAAILHAEGLLARATDNEAKHVPAGNWDNWKTALLALEGIPADTSPPSSPRDVTAAAPEKRKTLALKRTKPANPAQ